jgi:hypothetical protein
LEERRTGHHFTLHDTRRFLIGPWNIAGIISGIIRVGLQTTSTAAEASSFTFADLYRRPSPDIRSRYRSWKTGFPDIHPGQSDFQVEDTSGGGSILFNNCGGKAPYTANMERE